MLIERQTDLNLTALRKANFGLSECNRVKGTIDLGQHCLLGVVLKIVKFLITISYPMKQMSDNQNKAK